MLLDYKSTPFNYSYWPQCDVMSHPEARGEDSELEEEEQGLSFMDPPLSDAKSPVASEEASVAVSDIEAMGSNAGISEQAPQTCEVDPLPQIPQFKQPRAESGPSLLEPLTTCLPPSPIHQNRPDHRGLQGRALGRNETPLYTLAAVAVNCQLPWGTARPDCLALP